MKRLGQSSLEFVLLMTIMVVVFLIFFFVANTKVGEGETLHTRNMLAQLALVLDVEIDMASGMHPGYERTIYLEDHVNGVKYNITMNGSELMIHAGDEEHVLFLDVIIEGTFCEGANTIRQTSNNTIEVDAAGFNDFNYEVAHYSPSTPDNDVVMDAILLGRFGNSFRRHCNMSLGPAFCDSTDLSLINISTFWEQDLTRYAVIVFENVNYSGMKPGEANRLMEYVCEGGHFLYDTSHGTYPNGFLGVHYTPGPGGGSTSNSTQDEPLFGISFPGSANIIVNADTRYIIDDLNGWRANVKPILQTQDEPGNYTLSKWQCSVSPTTTGLVYHFSNFKMDFGPTVAELDKGVWDLFNTTNSTRGCWD